MIAPATITGTQTVRLSRNGDEKMLAPGTPTGVGLGVAANAVSSIIEPLPERAAPPGRPAPRRARSSEAAPERARSPRRIAPTRSRSEPVRRHRQESVDPDRWIPAGDGALARFAIASPAG